eukprot:gene9892-10905_t
MLRSLDDFAIAYPILTKYGHSTYKTISWGNSSSLPEKFYVKISFFGARYTILLKRNRKIVNPNYNTEEFINDKVKQNHGANRQTNCYYSGVVLKQRNSLVAVSTCHGLKGLITTRRGTFFIEPMRNLSEFAYPHLVYQPPKTQNSKESPEKKAEKSSCSVKQDPDPERYVLDKPVSEANVTSEEERYDGKQRRTRKRNTVEIPTADVEVFVVADKDTVDMHGNASIEEYVLTMMNMVSEMYKDRSLGVNVNIVVAKILALQEDQEDLKISHHGDRTLRNFCQWQYSRVWYYGQNNKRILKYDAAILLTRKDVCSNRDSPCGTIGMAYIGGVCKPKRRCSVIEDIGLNTAFTIAHELGHSLGMTHDSAGNHCSEDTNGVPHMMAPTWPQANHFGQLRWSKCSKEELKEFLSSYKSSCIRETSSQFHGDNYELSNSVLPGIMYNADQQCKFIYGPLASHCRTFKITGAKTDMCKSLWCQREGDDECVTKLDPAAKGTPCAPGKWCMYGQCISNNTIPDQIDGHWSQWSNWTGCSRTCGIGVTKRQRRCDNPPPSNGGRHCVGESKQYRTCNPEKCLKVSNFREQQCSNFNNKTVSWIPVLSERSPCVLFCRQDVPGIHYSVRFAATVTDGTECRKGAAGICVDGKCEELGCDNQLNSKMKEDACGVCGGNGTTCNIIQGEFTQMSGKGYVTAAVIPPGAKNVIVQEEKPCASFLALKGDHDTYHINGNWKIELPGEFDIDGTIVYYHRKGTQEEFFAKGPTREPLHIMVLFQDFNFGIKYRYTLPLKTNKTVKAQQVLAYKTSGSYGWMQGPWGPCSVFCAGGIKRRKESRCIHIIGNNVTVVGNEFCSGARKPPVEEKTCNEQKCPVAWAVGPWTSCSKTCGLGRKSRGVHCLAKKRDDGKWKPAPVDQCSKDKPVTLQICVEKSCYLNWRTGPWSKCDAKCGRGGMKRRNVTCPVKNACSITNKPISRTFCFIPKCSYQWIPSKWSQCSNDCDEGHQTRVVKCREVYSMQESEGKCTMSLKPRVRRKCFVKDCNAQVSTTSKARVETARNNATTLFIPAGAPTAGKKFLFAPVLDLKNCKKDRLAPWACEILVDKFFCSQLKDALKCCVTCRKKIGIQ